MLFSFQGYQQMGNALGQSDLLRSCPFEIARFENEEAHAVVEVPVANRPCFVLGSIAPPDSRLVELTLLAHTLKVQGASHTTAIIPYLAYTRQDKMKAGESLAAAWAGTLLRASGIDQILTVDVHSERDKQWFPIPLISLSPANLFAVEIEKRGLLNATIVAPDRGAITRCEAVKKALGLPSCDCPYFEKKRMDQGIVHGRLAGEVEKKAIIVDDMLDTGGTLMSACEKLIEAKVEEIWIFVTHGLFTGDEWQKLWSLRVCRVFCTDTISPTARIEGEERVTVLSVASMLQEALAGAEVKASR